MADGKEKNIFFYDFPSGQKTLECKLDTAGEDLRLSSDGYFLLSDVFFASTDGIESCKDTIQFLPADGIKRKKSSTLDRYPSVFVVDANAKSGLFFSVEMLAPQPKSYSGYVSRLNTRKKLLEMGIDPKSRKSARRHLVSPTMIFLDFRLTENT